MRAFHEERDASVTIALHHVEDARAFGLVDTEADGRVLAFREKPEDRMPGDINAGTYLLDPAALDAWEPGATLSIEREIFPVVIASGRPVYGFGSDAYWLDLGTPEKYRQAHFDMIEGKVHDVTYPAPWVAEGAEVDLRAHLGRWVAVSEGVRIGAGRRGRRLGPARRRRGGCRREAGALHPCAPRARRPRRHGGGLGARRGRLRARGSRPVGRAGAGRRGGRARLTSTPGGSGPMW